MKSITLQATFLLLTALSAAVSIAAEPTRPMPVVPSDDIIEFDWDAHAFDRPKTDVVNLSLLPEKVRALHGQRIRVRGYMMPSFKLEGIDRFILESAPQMRFGSNRPIDGLMAVTMGDAKTTIYYARRVLVEGTLTIDDWMFGDEKHGPILIYRLSAASVQLP